ncbi:hypothetical protein MHYP_G00207540 [Metynnis hypsauchen]
MKSSPESEELSVDIEFEGDIPEELVCEASNAVSKIRAKALECRVNHRVLLLAFGALTVLVTPTAALCYLQITRAQSPESVHSDQSVYTEIVFENEGEKKEWSEMQEMMVTYAEVNMGSGDDQ